MTEMTPEIQKAINELKDVSLDYIDEQDQPAWTRGFYAGVQAAHMCLSAAYPLDDKRELNRDEAIKALVNEARREIPALRRQAEKGISDLQQWLKKR